MILVTVGTEQYPFNRLMEWIDTLIKTHVISPEEQVVIQYGSCSYIPKNVHAYRLLPEAEFQDIIQKSRLIIAHCGEGTIDLLATLDIPFILVPRCHNLGEHVDNHQVELAEALAGQGVYIAHSRKQLAQFIHSPQLVNVDKAPSQYYLDICNSLNYRFTYHYLPQHSRRSKRKNPLRSLAKTSQTLWLEARNFPVKLTSILK